MKTMRVFFRANTASLALAFLATAMATPTSAAPAEKFLVASGPVPTELKLRAAISRYLQTTDRALDKRKPFKILSGPTLATGNTFGDSLEQAWLMCIVINAEKVGPGPQNIRGKSLYVRTGPAGEVTVVSTENWKDSSPKC